MTNLSAFEFNSTPVRFVGTPEAPEWVGVDIVAVLNPGVDTKNLSTYLRGVPDEWKGLRKVQTLGGCQDMVTLYEPGFYCLVARSNSPLAVPFQKWVYEDVLPSIRKTGGYQLPRQHNYYDEELSYSRKPKEWQEKTEISESQLKVFCFLREIDRWVTANEVSDATGLHPATVRSFLVYFRRAGLLDMLETWPRHMHKFSDKAEARNPSFLMRLERAVKILGNPLSRKLPLIE